jgi:hypothetical protein
MLLGRIVDSSIASTARGAFGPRRSANRPSTRPWRRFGPARSSSLPNEVSPGSWWTSGSRPCGLQGAALHLAQLPEERRAAHRSRPRPPPAPTADAGTAHRLIEDCSRPGIGREAAALPQRRSATSMAPCTPRSGTRFVGAMSPATSLWRPISQRAWRARCASGVRSSSAPFSTTSEPTGCMPPGCCWPPPACAGERWPGFAGPMSTWTPGACRPGDRSGRQPPGPGL